MPLESPARVTPPLRPDRRGACQSAGEEQDGSSVEEGLWRSSLLPPGPPRAAERLIQAKNVSAIPPARLNRKADLIRRLPAQSTKFYTGATVKGTGSPLLGGRLGSGVRASVKPKEERDAQRQCSGRAPPILPWRESAAHPRYGLRSLARDFLLTAVLGSFAHDVVPIFCVPSPATAQGLVHCFSTLRRPRRETRLTKEGRQGRAVKDLKK